MTRLAALLPFALVACVDNGDEGMYVVENTAVTGACTLTGSPDQPFISHGLINYGSPVPYQLTPLIQSRLMAVEMDGDVVARTIQLRRADITLQLVAVSTDTATTQKDVALPPLSSLFSGALPPGGFINVGFDLIPASTLKSIATMSGVDPATTAFAAEVVASITIKGVINGDEISSAPYVYPVTVCSECVINIVGDCPMTVGTPRAGNACNPFQDGAVDCCRETTGSLTCPARTL